MGRAKRAPPCIKPMFLVGLASLDPPYLTPPSHSDASVPAGREKAAQGRDCGYQTTVGRRLQGLLDDRPQHVRRDVDPGVDQQHGLLLPALNLTAQRQRRVVAGHVAHQAAAAGGEVQLEVGDLGRTRAKLVADRLQQGAGQRLPVDLVLGLQSGGGVQPAQGGLARGVGVVVHRDDLSAGRPVTVEIIQPGVDALAAGGRHAQQRRIGEPPGQRGFELGQLAGCQEVGLVQYDQVGLFELLLVDVKDIVGKPGRFVLGERLP